MFKSPASPTETSTSARSRSSRKPLLSPARYALPLLSLLVVVGLVVRAVAANSREVGRSLRLLGHPAPTFLVLAVVAEVLSYASYASAQRQLALAAGHRLGRGWLAALAVAAQALVDFLPAGYLAGNVLNFRQLRRRSLSIAHSAWLLGITSLLYMTALLALACIGAVIDTHGGWVPRLAGLCGLLVIAGATALGASTDRGSHLKPLRRSVLAVLAWMERRTGAAARFAASSRDVARQMSETRLTRPASASVAALFAVSWLSDCACLACGFAAMGLTPPWNSLLVAYAAAQLVSFLPIAPGGFGLVEGGLTVTLTTGGRTVSTVLAAVLLYRVVSYWATLPCGALGYLGLRSRRWEQPSRDLGRRPPGRER